MRWLLLLRVKFYIMLSLHVCISHHVSLTALDENNRGYVTKSKLLKAMALEPTVLSNEVFFVNENKSDNKLNFHEVQHTLSTHTHDTTHNHEGMNLFAFVICYVVSCCVVSYRLSSHWTSGRTA